MKTLLCLMTLLAAICGLQQAFAADDNVGETSGVEVTAPSETRPSEDELQAPEDSKAAKIAGAEAEAEAEDTTVPVVHHPDSQGYHLEMEEINRIADEQDSKLEGKIPPETPMLAAEELVVAENAVHQANVVLKEEQEEDMEKLSRVAADDDSQIDPKAKPDLRLFPEGYVPEEEQEPDVPSKYPMINPDMTHVTYVVADDNTVHLSLEYSKFDGADKYEFCVNCHMKDNVRFAEETSGEVKSIDKESPFFCEEGPACFSEIIWTVGAHDFSMRAHTDKGWTPWSPNMQFEVEAVVGMAQHNDHDEL